MANKEHLVLLEKGVDAWNEWRRQNLAISPDLCFEDLRGMDLKMAHLGAADLMGTNLSGKKTNLGGRTFAGRT